MHTRKNTVRWPRRHLMNNGGRPVFGVIIALFFLTVLELDSQKKKINDTGKVGRSDLGPCGRGEKYKNCGLK